VLTTTCTCQVLRHCLGKVLSSCRLHPCVAAAQPVSDRFWSISGCPSSQNGITTHDGNTLVLSEVTATGAVAYTTSRRCGPSQ
jgi:hypothetical protein